MAAATEAFNDSADCLFTQEYEGIEIFSVING